MIGRYVNDPPYIKEAKVPAFDKIGFTTLCVWTGCLQIILDKGQEVDWFGAVWLRWAAVAFVVALVWFIYQSWVCENPLVDLQVLKDRNFGLGCVLIFLFGIGIYSTVTVLPLFYQELLAYTAFTAGVAVAPRGLGAILGMPVIGALTSKVDPRILLTFGFCVFGATTLYFGNITMDISPTTLFLPILITGFGLSFVFVPINTAAYGTLKNTQIGNASGLFNLMRNVGGSIGISVATTLLTRRAAAHQNDIVNAVPRTGQAFQDAVAAGQQSLSGYFGPANARAASQVNLYGQLQRQAALWSFVDVFRWLSLLCFFCVIVVWMLKRVRPGKGPAGAH